MITLTGAFLALLVLALLERWQISRIWKEINALKEKVGTSELRRRTDRP